MAEQVDGLGQLVAAADSEADGQAEQGGADEAAGPAQPRRARLGVVVGVIAVDGRVDQRSVTHQRLARHFLVNPGSPQYVPRSRVEGSLPGRRPMVRPQEGLTPAVGEHDRPAQVAGLRPE